MTARTEPLKRWPRDPFELIPLVDLPNYLAPRRSGKNIALSTVYRWRTGKLRRSDEERDPEELVRLRCRMRGTHWYTCKAWFDEFEDAVTAAAELGEP